MTAKGKQRLLIAATALLGLAVILLAAFDTRLTVRTYEATNEKAINPVRIALITDFHCCDYGVDNRELLDAVEGQAPDIVLLGGDIIDDDRALPWERGYELAAWLAERWPTYYVTGNHEFWSNEVDDICAQLEKRGVSVLRGQSATVAGLTICGVDDPDVGEDIWQGQLKRLSEELDQETVSILLTHRPERVEAYRDRGFDLVLAGHAHGGQWRLPGVLNGVAAPNQGLFPRYAGGWYDLGENTTLVVSRGLARETTRIPRAFNPPEVVIIDVVRE